MAGAGYKLFQTGDVLTAAQVNTYLNEQTVMVFASAAARTTALTSVLAEGMMSYLQDTNSVEVYNGTAWVAVGGGASPLTTKGDLYTFSTVDARLGVGTNGQYLSADSTASTGLKWVTPASGGKVLQVVSAVYTTQTTITSATYTDTGLTVSITPSSASSKVLILVAQSLLIDQSANQSNFYTALLRGATNIFEPQYYGVYAASSTSGTSLNGVISMAYLDSPSTTSSTTYKTQGKKDGNTQGRYQYSSHASSIIALEIGA